MPKCVTRLFRLPIIFAAILLLIGTPAFGWLRVRYEDLTVVQRSDLIVIAAVKPGSVVYIPHPTENGAHSWEHHATLLVRQVLKGHSTAKEIPVTIEYGMDPMPWNDHGPTTRAVATTQPLAIDDTGNSDRGRPPVLQDALADNVWLLRQNKSGYFVRDPEDLQPISLKDYLACYLAKDPAVVVRSQLQHQPEIAERGLRYLNHVQLQTILTEPNPAIRIERLIPYFLNDTFGDSRAEASDAILRCGPIAGPYLMGIYQATEDANLRAAIIPMWGRMRYAGCTDLLIQLLSKSDPFWAGQNLKPGWWNTDVNSEQTRVRRQVYAQVFASVWTLERIGNPRARAAIEQTRSRWQKIHFENPQIVEECDRAIAVFDRKK
jgi:hypothetical protein